ncbi:alpha/beta hydrolase family esterase [Actinokineospora guangxiensis]|uniref:Alpha/beta hydrolase family esterase n=1 Tax=Actinokineospora guangxiensis TaxID=1490288 RepID=A0ABW0ERB0_9PSEU
MFLFAVLALLPLLSPVAPTPEGGCAPPGEYTEATWPLVQHTPDGRPVARTYRAHVPPNARGGLVLDLHGAFSGKEEQDDRSGMRAKADAGGFVAVQPDSWPHWTTSAADEAARGVSDSEFLRRLVGITVEQLCVAPAKVYAVGFSSGGLMAARFACSGTTKLAGIGMVAAAPLPDTAPCHRPLPLRLVFSHNDHVLARCCSGDLGAMTAGVHALARQWADDNGCVAPPREESTGETGWGVRVKTVHHLCPGRGDVVVDQIDTGDPVRDGHFWPGPPSRAPFDATSAIVSFWDGV